MSELPELDLSVQTTASADELWSCWQQMRELGETAGDRMTDAGQRWKDTADPLMKDCLWVEYEAVARDYRVLAAWKDVFYAAFIFATDGADCAVFDVSSSS